MREESSRATLRKAFPPIAPDLAQFDFPALAAWGHECRTQQQLASRWTLSGWRWHRAASLADREYTRRLLAHPGAMPGTCDYCQSKPVTTHVAYNSRAEPRFAHYCQHCAAQMPSGWLSVVAFAPRGIA